MHRVVCMNTNNCRLANIARRQRWFANGDVLFSLFAPIVGVANVLLLISL